MDEARLAEREAGLQFDDPINIQYTSGTTGLPKGATLSHHNVLNNGYFIGEALRYTDADRVCIPVPFYHCFGMVLGNLACTTHGACIVVPGEAYEPLAALASVQAERCTSLYGVPTMFLGELDHPRFAEFDLSSSAHGHHGRVALSHRGHEARAGAHAHERGDDLLRDDGDLARLHAEPDHGLRASGASPRWGACIRTSRSRW